MNRNRGAKDDFCYAFVMFAMRAVVIFNVVAQVVANEAEGDFADFDRAVMAANDRAHAVVCMYVA